MTPNQKGDIAEARVLASLLEANYSVSVPWGDNQRYDLLVDTGTNIQKVQCKMGRLKNGSIDFSLRSTPGKGKKPKPYGNSVDSYGVYCPETDMCYLVPVEDVKNTGASLRVDPLKNNQGKNIRFAKKYEIISVVE